MANRNRINNRPPPPEPRGCSKAILWLAFWLFILALIFKIAADLQNT